MKKRYIILGMIVAAATVSCTDSWEEHYAPPAQSALTLWEEISTNEDLSDFAMLLQSRGYDKLLSSNQRFTVWGPNGEIDTSFIAGGVMSEEEITTQVIENHIARSLISVSPAKKDSIKTLNGKLMKIIGDGLHTTFNGVHIEEPNIECSNGLLHITQQQVRFNNNIWTYLRQDADLQLLCDYLYGFNRQVFDSNASTLGGIVGGEKVYSDSVFVTTNELWSKIGYLNAENTSYIMTAPTNNAWNEVVEEFKAFYHYPEGIYMHMGDSVAKRRIADYLVRRIDSEEELPYEAFINDTVECSNGTILKAEALNIDPYETFVQDIVIEGEAETYMTKEPSNCDVTNVFVVTGKNELSKNRYIKLVATSPLLKPTVTYVLPDVLSCKYDIGIVFVPMNLTKNGYSSVIEQKGGRVDVELRDDHVGEVYKNAGLDIDGTKIDTVWVREGHDFEFCDYYPNREKLTDSKLTLKITGVVKRNESTLSRDLYIDCIVLRPRKY